MPGLWPPPLGMAVVGVLGRRDDTRVWSGLRSTWPTVKRRGPSANPHATPAHCVAGQMGGKGHQHVARPFGIGLALWFPDTLFQGIKLSPTAWRALGCLSPTPAT